MPSPPLPWLYTPALLLGLLLGCGDEGAQDAATKKQPYRYNLSVRVTTDDSEPSERRPIHSVPILLDGDVIGYTGKDGTLEAYFIRRMGQQVEIKAGDMTDHIYPGEQSKTVTLEAKKRATGLETVPVSFNTQLSSIRTDYLIWTKVDCSSLEASCEDLPVKIGEEIVATTDAAGRAQFVYSGSPGQALQVVVDASTVSFEEEGDALKDTTLTLDLILDKSATVYLLEAKLELKDPPEEAEPKKKASPRRKTSSKKSKPKKERVVKSKPKKAEEDGWAPAKKKKKSTYGGPIDIFAD